MLSSAPRLALDRAGDDHNGVRKDAAAELTRHAVINSFPGVSKIRFVASTLLTKLENDALLLLDQQSPHEDVAQAKAKEQLCTSSRFVLLARRPGPSSQGRCNVYLTRRAADEGSGVSAVSHDYRADVYAAGRDVRVESGWGGVSQYSTASVLHRSQLSSWLYMHCAPSRGRQTAATYTRGDTHHRGRLRIPPSRTLFTRRLARPVVASPITGD